MAHRAPPDPTVLNSKLDRYPDEAWGWELRAYPWSSPSRGSQSMVLICPSAGGRGVDESSCDGERSRSIKVKSRQQAVVVAQVMRPMCPRTALICFRVHRAIAGCKSSMAAESHCPAHRRAMREGWLGMVSRRWKWRPNSCIGPTEGA